MSKILIIEDDQNLLEGLQLLFQIAGHQAIGTWNGLIGLDLIRSERPDLILTNYQMPGADGFEVLRAVRNDRSLRDLPVIFLTADHKPSVRSRALDAGANAFITKPFSTESLSATVAELLGAPVSLAKAGE